jgi:type IV secretion system protein VirD4
MKAKYIVLSLFLCAWLGVGVYVGRYIAGGMFLITYKSNPMAADETTWQSYWNDYQDYPKERKKLILSAGVPVAIFLGIPLIMFLASLTRPRSLHGDARFATGDEVNKAGLFAEKGMILGKFNGKYLINGADKFVLLIAPTRSGKGVGVIVPNLLNWDESCIVSDIKGENFDVTSGFRAAHGQAVYKFAPFDPEGNTHCWNPLSYIDRDPRFVVGDLQSIGYMLYPRKEGTDSFWSDQARNLFVGVSLYCLDCGIPLTMGQVLKRATGNGKPKEFWQGVVESGATPDGVVLSPSCLSALSQFTSNSENTLTSILSSFTAPLGIFANPIVDCATSSDDFDIRDIRKKRMTIYIVVPPNKLSEASLIMNLFFSLTYDQNTKVLPENDSSLKYLCLMIQDEFPALGKVLKFETAVGYLAGYGFRCITVAQSVSQLQSERLYGKEGARTLVANHKIQVMYAPTEQQDATEYSEILGYETMDGVSKGRSYSKGMPSRSENVSDHKRALMLPQELRELGPEREIVIVNDCKPIFAEKIQYYSDKAFIPRLLPAVKIPTVDLDAFLSGKPATTSLGPNTLNMRSATALNAMPHVTSSPAGVVIQREAEAVADWLFKQIDWYGGELTPAPSGLTAS